MQQVRQATIILPYFNEEVPVVYVEDGTPYIPVTALCAMLGLHAKTHIRRWRKLVLWTNARKLPLQMESGRMSLVWCLHMGALPLWCGCFDWSLVMPERQEQLHQATDAWFKIAEQAHQQMLTDYEAMRRLLFAFLSTYADGDALLSRFALHLSVHLDSRDACLQLEALMARGQLLIREATGHARAMIHEQADAPIIDGVELDQNGRVGETFSLPLFPVFPHQDCLRFFEYLGQLEAWRLAFAHFLKAHELSLAGTDEGEK